MPSRGAQGDGHTWSTCGVTILNASRCAISTCCALTLATSCFMNTLYALRARGTALGSLSPPALRFRLRLLPGGCVESSAVGWICTAKTALHWEHWTEVMPSGRRTWSCAVHVGHVTWNHCMQPAIVALDSGAAARRRRVPVFAAAESRGLESGRAWFWGCLP